MSAEALPRLRSSFAYFKRITAGLGVGWLIEEYAALGADFHHRGRNMDEIIRVLRALWAGGTVTNDGPGYPFGPVDFGPPPPPIPIVLGGTSLAALRRAAHQVLDTPLVFASLLSISALTTAGTAVVVGLEWWLLAWRPSRRRRPSPTGA